MKLVAVSVLDLVAQVFGPIMLYRSLPESKRDFENACRSPQSIVGDHPEDLRLMYIGDFDDCSGEFVSLVPVFVCNGIPKGYFAEPVSTPIGAAAPDSDISEG